MAATQRNQVFLPWSPIHSFRQFLAKMHHFARIENIRQTDRQTERRQTDRRHIVPKARPIVRSAKKTFILVWAAASKTTRRAASHPSHCKQTWTPDRDSHKLQRRQSSIECWQHLRTRWRAGHSEIFLNSTRVWGSSREKYTLIFEDTRISLQQCRTGREKPCTNELHSFWHKTGLWQTGRHRP